MWLAKILPLGVLRCFSCPLKSGFLSLFNPGVAGKQSVLAEDRLKVLIYSYQGSGNAMRDSAALPRNTAASYLDHGVVLAEVLTD